MLRTLGAIAAKLREAAQSMVDAGAVPEHSTAAVWNGSDKKDMMAKLPGSVLRVEDPVSGAASLWTVTFGDRVLSGSATDKIGVLKNGAGAVKAMTSDELTGAGVTHALLGVLTTADAAGAHASALNVGGLAATIRVVPANNSFHVL